VKARVPSAKTQQFPALTGLRFVLALWVILHHLTGKGMMLEPWMHSLPPGARALVRGGYLAVGTFFVLSGFVLARSYSSTSWNRRSLVRYGIARVARVYPAYLLSLMIVLPFIYDWIFFTNRAASDKAAQIANYSFVLQGWMPKLSVFWNTPAWSLSCELFFYLCFPLAITCLGTRTWPRILLTIAACLALPALLIAIGVPQPWKPIHHMADFLLGIAAAGAYDWIVKYDVLRRGFWLYSPAALIGGAVIAFPALVERWITVNGALRPLNAALLLGLALGGGLPARALSTRIAGFLGKASYSMYILHIPLLWWFKRCWLYGTGVLSPNLEALVYIAGVILISAAACQFVEEPANRCIREWARVRIPIELRINASEGAIL
jgi:peptidoglycan/LPS O-acetylase OafA/YrhL